MFEALCAIHSYWAHRALGPRFVNKAITHGYCRSLKHAATPKCTGALRSPYRERGEACQCVALRPEVEFSRTNLALALSGNWRLLGTASHCAENGAIKKLGVIRAGAGRQWQ